MTCTSAAIETPVQICKPSIPDSSRTSSHEAPGSRQCSFSVRSRLRIPRKVKYRPLLSTHTVHTVAVQSLPFQKDLSYYILLVTHVRTNSVLPGSSPARQDVVQSPSRLSRSSATRSYSRAYVDQGDMDAPRTISYCRVCKIVRKDENSARTVPQRLPYDSSSGIFAPTSYHVRPTDDERP